MNICPETARRRTEETWGNGLNCAEVIVKSFSELGATDGIELDLLLTLASGFGSGIGNKQCDCGALTAAVMVLNIIAAGRIQKKKELYKLTGGFAERFNKEFGNIRCETLKQESGVSCKEITIRTAQMLAEHINESFNGKE